MPPCRLTGVRMSSFTALHRCARLSSCAWLLESRAAHARGAVTKRAGLVRRLGQSPMHAPCACTRSRLWLALSGCSGGLQILCGGVAVADGKAEVDAVGAPAEVPLPAAVWVPGQTQQAHRHLLLLLGGSSHHHPSVCAPLQLLGAFKFVEGGRNLEFLDSTQNQFVGGFSKWPDSDPDPMHAYMGIAGMSLMGVEDLLPLHPALNLSQ
ncbi:hypothetical protein HPB47_015728 [Ixodes persulcatus]|uniref:Uncharacterized protein n=1 Tax=Ixodes persulcatus TaxID=34615 RepID=A0AC60QVA5_IXOPE|nr:hypothetical protein HPB47_015728 [Ixodes persulcatus]